jgi:haloacetate dehalogenase
LALWGDEGIPARKGETIETADPLATWREWCLAVEGCGIDSGHFVAEENPEALLARLQPFLAQHGR